MMEAWQSLLNRLQQIRDLRPHHASLSMDRQPNQLHLVPACPIARRLRTERPEEDEAQLRNRQHGLHDVWTSGSGAIYRRLKEESYAPLLTFMGRLVHAPATSLQEMDGLMHDVWQLITYMVDGKRDAANFVCRYGRHL